MATLLDFTQYFYELFIELIVPYNKMAEKSAFNNEGTFRAKTFGVPFYVGSEWSSKSLNVSLSKVSLKFEACIPRGDLLKHFF